MVRKSCIALAAFALILIPGAALADTTSYVGTLASAEDVFTQTFTVSVAGDITVQTYGFGGGVNAAGTVIAPGGDIDFVGIFSGDATTGQILTDGMGNPFGTSAVLSNYGSFMGCPPAGAPVIGGCNDITMTVAVSPGVYTVLLSDVNYFPVAVQDNGTLDEGFFDLTGGVFCNAEFSDGSSCTSNGDYALDITSPSGSNPAVPEPGSMLLLGTGLSALVLFTKRR